MRKILFFMAIILAQPCFSQSMYTGAVNTGKQVYGTNTKQTQSREEKVETKFKNSEQSETMKENIKNMRGSIGSSHESIQARNLLMLQEILNFKIQDETLAPQIAKLRQNREFNAKLLKALNQLDNKKNRNNKNQEIINILNDAGNRIYNSLLN